MVRFCVLALVILAIACRVPLVNAQDEGLQDADRAGEPGADPSPIQTARPPQGPPSFVYTLAQTMDAHSVPHIGGGGRATTSRTRSEFTITWLASPQTRASLQLSNEFAFYDFVGARGVDPIEGNPFRGFNRQNADLLVTHAIDERWAVLALGGFGIAREGNADVGDSIIGRGGVGFSYRVTPGVSLGVSVLANTQLEGRTRVVPLPQVDATFTLDERWTLRLATIGGSTLSYRLNEEVTFQLKAGYEERQFRLDDDGFAPKGVFQDKHIDLGLGVLWTPTPGLELNAGIAIQPWRRFKVKDQDGHRLTRRETDPTYGLYAGISYRF